MSSQCPSCTSPQTASLHPALKVGALVGTISGVARGASVALASSQAGTAVVALTSPLSIPLATLSSAILGGLAGGVGARCTARRATRPPCARQQPLLDLWSSLQSAGLIGPQALLISFVRTVLRLVQRFMSAIT